jgi:hypothetical protein
MVLAAMPKSVQRQFCRLKSVTTPLCHLQLAQQTSLEGTYAQHTLGMQTWRGKRGIEKGIKNCTQKGIKTSIKKGIKKRIKKDVAESHQEVHQEGRQ